MISTLLSITEANKEETSAREKDPGQVFHLSLTIDKRICPSREDKTVAWTVGFLVGDAVVGNAVGIAVVGVSVGISVVGVAVG